VSSSEAGSSIPVAAGSGGRFVIWDANRLIYVALQTTICCYANKDIVAGIWYA
jgi:hypothetical protein